MAVGGGVIGNPYLIFWWDEDESMCWNEGDRGGNDNGNCNCDGEDDESDWIEEEREKWSKQVKKTKLRFRGNFTRLWHN